MGLNKRAAVALIPADNGGTKLDLRLQVRRHRGHYSMITHNARIPSD